MSHKNHKPKKSITPISESITNCKHDLRIRCKQCDKFSDSCTLQLILADTNTILRAFLQEEMDKSIQFLNDNRKKYIIVTTPIVLGEIIKVCREKQNDDQFTTLLNSPEFKSYVNNTHIIETNFKDSKFLDILNHFKRLELRSLDRDILLLAILIYYNKYRNYKLKIFTLDNKLKEDIRTINDSNSDYNIKIFKQ